MGKIKRLPSGVSNFVQIRRENMYYVDKTMFLPMMEMAGNFLFLVRPRRFGKSLFLSMVEKYYDVKAQQEWNELFGGLWIYEHSTEWRHKFQVLKLDFSQIGGGMDSLSMNVDAYLKSQLIDFVSKYKDDYEEGFLDEIKNTATASLCIVKIANEARERDHHLYLVIDEYDNFTNTVLTKYGNEMYRTLTHGEGFYRDIFKNFKGNFDRILMMGVSPITLDDLTSGFNIATNITADFRFNQMLGFSKEDVREMMDYYEETGTLQGNVNEMMEEMKPWYDNYCFSKESFRRGESKVFNGYMVLHYLNARMNTGLSPEKMLVPNTLIDYDKLEHLIKLEQQTNGLSRRGTIQQIIDDGFIYSELVDYFPAENIVKDENFVSLLYYYGMLTITGVRGTKVKLGIPNNNVRKQYYDYIRQHYVQVGALNTSVLSNAYDAAAFDGEWKPLLQYIADSYDKLSSIRNSIQGERNIQGFFMAFLALSNLYLMLPELEMAHGYGDIFLMPDKKRYPEIMHSYIIELKYLKADDTEATVKGQQDEATLQLRRYAQDEKVRFMAQETHLHLIVMQFRQSVLVKMEEILKI